MVLVGFSGEMNEMTIRTKNRITTCHEILNNLQATFPFRIFILWSTPSYTLTLQTAPIASTEKNGKTLSSLFVFFPLPLSCSFSNLSRTKRKAFFRCWCMHKRYTLVRVSLWKKKLHAHNFSLLPQKRRQKRDVMWGWREEETGTFHFCGSLYNLFMSWMGWWCGEEEEKKFCVNVKSRIFFVKKVSFFFFLFCQCRSLFPFSLVVVFAGFNKKYVSPYISIWKEAHRVLFALSFPFSQYFFLLYR